MGKRNCIDMAIQLLDFGNFLQQLGKIEGFEGTGFEIFHHSNGAARVDQ
jgi:hypothetical protein